VEDFTASACVGEVSISTLVSDEWLLYTDDALLHRDSLDELLDSEAFL
jgi:hypothetical protein